VPELWKKSGKKQGLSEEEREGKQCELLLGKERKKAVGGEATGDPERGLLIEEKDGRGASSERWKRSADPSRKRGDGGGKITAWAGRKER